MIGKVEHRNQMRKRLRLTTRLCRFTSCPYTVKCIPKIKYVEIDCYFSSFFIFNYFFFGHILSMWITCFTNRDLHWCYCVVSINCWPICSVSLSDTLLAVLLFLFFFCFALILFPHSRIYTWLCPWFNAPTIDWICVEFQFRMVMRSICERAISICLENVSIPFLPTHTTLRVR